MDRSPGPVTGYLAEQQAADLQRQKAEALDWLESCHDAIVSYGTSIFFTMPHWVIGIKGKGYAKKTLLEAINAAREREKK